MRHRNHVIDRPDHWLAPHDLRAAGVAQREIAEAAEDADRFGTIATIAGVDTSMKWRDSRGPIHAAAAPIGWPRAAPRPAASVSMIPAIPYIPGYLGFREAPAIIQAVDRLERRPDLLIVDGHGRPHPRRCGIAVHVGVLLDIPSIGCAKSILCGEVEGELGPNVGDRAPIVDRGELVGYAVRTRPKTTPVYIGSGHRISLDTAVDWILKLSDGRRLPLPIRLAHDAANAARREYEAAAQ
ncbi:endonuclease V [Sphingomonas sp. Leaf33]|uniref:endonuclease V n=1 Tax=Sphingomonas sp. Leaf33 TaxID=1736215 RepID=UPI0006FE0501|nr:endonuclease V [Sphingomonas sp. Leaf33]KQN25235.1 endonuclease V [Sphingomonas sp. Leaf33]